MKHDLSTMNSPYTLHTISLKVSAKFCLSLTLQL